jgi:outer membrane protein TolC
MNRKISLFALFLTSAFLGQSQDLDLETCLRMADTANLSLRNARLDVSINEKERSAYLSARLPQLSAIADYKYNAIIQEQVVPAAFFGGPPGTYATVAFGVPYNLGNSFQLSQILFNSQLEYGLAALRINNQIVAIQEKMTEQDVRHQVASTFFNLQGVNKQLNFIEGNLKNMEKLIVNMQAMADQKLVIQTEVDKLTINKLSLENSMQTLQATKWQLESLMRILIGLEPGTPFKLASDQLVEKSILVERSEMLYSELELIKAQQQMNAEERKGNNMAYLPNLSLYGSYNYTYNIEPEEDFRKGIEGAFVGIRLDWKLFDGLEKIHKQKANAMNAEKLANTLEQTQQQLALRTENALRQIEIQKNSLEITKEQLKLSENIFNQTRTKLEQGLVSSNDMITADNSLQQSQTNLVTAYIQLRQAELEYLKSIGNIK